MSDDGASPDTSSGPGIPAGAVSRELPIINKRGLHARASAKFVKLAETYDATITVARDGHEVGGTSIMGLMMLAEPIISVLYQHGKFTAYEAAQAAGALRFYAIGLAGYAAL